MIERTKEDGNLIQIGIFVQNESGFEDDFLFILQ